MDTAKISRIPDCRRCRHYFISHDARFPYGCHALDFKSAHLPMQEVLQASGQPCQFFVPKAS